MASTKNQQASGINPLDVFEDARIGDKNFKGLPNRFGDDNGRTFRIYFTEDPERAEALAAEGFNIRGGNPIEDQPGEFWPRYLEVKALFEPYPPEIWVVNGTDKNEPVLMNADTVAMLDSQHFLRADVIIRRREWKPGRIKAYVKKMYVTIDKEAVGLDPLTSRYGF